MTPVDLSTSLCGLVLAGGRSMRMGRDKAALVHPDGRPLARRAYDLLVSAGCASVMLSLRHDQPLPPGFADVPDVAVLNDPEGSGGGPMAGILAALRLRRDVGWLVLACDLPRLDERTLRHLIASRREDEAFLSYRSEFDGLPEPLCAYYGAAALPLVVAAQAQGIACPRKLLINQHCRLLEPPTPRALDNANTPDDWSSAITSLDHP